MPRKKLDVEQIGWDEQIKENVSISGSFTVTGSIIQNGNQLKITSAGPTSLFLQADTDNVTETDTAFVKLTQDGAYLTSYLGYIGNDDQDPEGGSLVNAKANTLLLSCNNSFPGALSRIQIATENNVRMTIEDDGKIGIGTISPESELHISNTSTNNLLTLETTEDSSTASPVIKLKRNSSSPSNSDYLGQLKFQGENNADQQVTYAKITAKVGSVTDGSEQGILEFANMKNGSSGITARLKHDALQLVNDTNLTVDGKLAIGLTSPATELHIDGALTLNERTSDPSNPAEGRSVLWMSDGTGSGDDGDIMIKITAGGVTKTITLVDFSAS